MFKNFALNALFIGAAAVSFSIDSNAQSSAGQELLQRVAAAGRSGAAAQDVVLVKEGKDQSAVFQSNQTDGEKNSSKVKTDGKKESAEIADETKDDQSSDEVSPDGVPEAKQVVDALSDANRGHAVFSNVACLVTGALAASAWYNRASLSGLANTISSAWKASLGKCNKAVVNLLAKLGGTYETK